MKRYIFRVCVISLILATYACSNGEVDNRLGTLKIRSYSESSDLDPSEITVDWNIDAILEVTYPDGSTETIVTDGAGWYDFGSVASGNYTIKPRYTSDSYERTLAVPPGGNISAVIVTPYAGLYYYSFNTISPPLDSLSVRQALCKAIVRQDIVNSNTHDGVMILGYNTVLPQLDGSWAASAKVMVESTVAANDSLGDAGQLEVNIIYNNLDSDVHKNIAETVELAWEALTGSGTSSISVESTGFEWTEFLEMRDDQMDFQVARCGWLLDSNNLLGLYKSFSFIQQQEYLDLLLAADTALDNRNFIEFEQGLVASNDYLIDKAFILPMYYY